MKTVSSLVIAVILVLVLGTVIAGCLQYPSANQGQPIQSTGQSGTGVPQASPAVSTTNPYGGQYNNPSTIETPQTGETKKFYDVTVTVYRNRPDQIIVTYNGGQDAAYVESIWWYVDGVNEGVMSAGNGQTSLPSGTQIILPATNPNRMTMYHVVAIGHFTDGSTQTMIDLQT
jgi:hypothetical protein